jgi:hypothetical protein
MRIGVIVAVAVGVVLLVLAAAGILNGDPTPAPPFQDRPVRVTNLPDPVPPPAPPAPDPVPPPTAQAESNYSYDPKQPPSMVA